MPSFQSGSHGVRFHGLRPPHGRTADIHLKAQHAVRELVVERVDRATRARGAAAEEGEVVAGRTVHRIGCKGKAGRLLHRGVIHPRLSPGVLVLVVRFPHAGDRGPSPVVAVERMCWIVVIRHPAVAGERQRARARREVVAVDIAAGGGEESGKQSKQKHQRSPCPDRGKFPLFCPVHHRLSSSHTRTPCPVRLVLCQNSRPAASAISRRQVSGLRSPVPPAGLGSQVSCQRAGSHFACGGPSARQSNCGGKGEGGET